MPLFGSQCHFSCCGFVEPGDWLFGDWGVEEGTQGFPVLGTALAEVKFEQVVLSLAEVCADAGEVCVVGPCEGFAVKISGGVDALADDGFGAVGVFEFVFAAFTVVFDAVEPWFDFAEGEDEL